MNVVKTGSKTFAHTYHRINPRSKVNMYVASGLNQESVAAKRAAQPTVEGSLLKSRMVTNRWLGMVSKKKRELEEKLFKINELNMLPYSEYFISSGNT